MHVASTAALALCVAALGMWVVVSAMSRPTAITQMTTAPQRAATTQTSQGKIAAQTTAQATAQVAAATAPWW